MSTYSLTEDDTKKLLVLSLFISYAQLFLYLIMFLYVFSSTDTHDTSC